MLNACKTKFQKGKRSFNKRIPKSNSWSKKRLQFVRCLILKETDTNKKLKLFSKESSKMSWTSTKNTLDLSKELKKKKTTSTTKTNCSEMKLRISKVKETLLRNSLSNRKSNNKAKESSGEKRNKTIRKPWQSISLKMKTWKRPAWDKRLLPWDKSTIWLQTTNWKLQHFSQRLII